MLDRNEPQDGRNGRDLPQRTAAGEPLARRAHSDREVPLPSGSSTAIHQWLDGDLSETDARRADDGQVEFWSRVSVETARRRRLTTPAHIAGQIMAALPDKEIALQVNSDRLIARTNGVSKSTAAVIGVGFFTLGVVVGRLFDR